MDITNLLTQWDMPELIPIFIEHEITIPLLPVLLETNTLNAIVPKVGRRLILENKIREYLSETVEQDSHNLSFINDLDDEEPTQEAYHVEDTLLEIVRAPSPVSSTNSHSVSQTQSPLSDFDLAQLLESSAFGRALVSWHKLKGCLDSTRQGYLVDIISTYFINQNIIHLSNNDFKVISAKIVEIFPSEITEAYYLPPTRKRDSINNKAGIAKGKLVDKFRNKLTFLRQAGILPSRNSESTSETESITDQIEQPESKELLNWLKHNRQPLNEIYDRWDRLFTDRRQKLIKENITYNVFSEYPILSNEVGLLLIERDFQKLFSNSTDLLFNKWETVISKLIKLRGKFVTAENDKILIDILDAEDISNDYKHYVMLTLLASLLPNKSRHLYGRARKHWKPTVVDSKNGIVIRAEIAGDIENKIKAKAEKLTALEIPVQPFVVVEGSGTTIRHIYAYINEQLYQVPTLLKAVDTCFKAYHVFHLRYQTESEHIWAFVQHAIYDIKSKWDVAIPNILDIVNKVKQISD